MDTSPAPRSTPRVRRELAGGKRPLGHRTPQPVRRPDPRRFSIEPTDAPLTAFSGLVGFGVFLRKIGIDRELHDAFDPLKPSRLTVYSMGDVLRLIIDAQVLGRSRVFAIEALAGDALFTALAGGQIPSVDVLYDDLRRFGPEDLQRLRNLAIEQGLAELRSFRGSVLHLDLDSTVEPLFGTQQGAKAGPNPRYRGRPSYHPLVARVAETGTVVGAKLREGDTAFGDDDVEWVESVIDAVRAAVGANVMLVVRIDAAGDCTEVLRAIDAKGAVFVVKAKMTADLCEVVASVPSRRWQTVERGVNKQPLRQVTAVTFSRRAWDAAAVRWEVIAVREWDRTGGRKLFLWEGEDWTAYALLSNGFDWPEEDIVDAYAARAGIEPLIGELKHGYGMGAVPTEVFSANEAMFLLKVLTHNLVRRYLREHHPHMSGWSIAWVRAVVLLVPGKLVRHARRISVHVPARSALVKRLN